MLNHIVLQGRLTRDPELRYTQSNTPVCSFTLAVERDRKDAHDERQVDFIDCVAWRATAEFVRKYFSKGSGAAVTGRLQIREYTNQIAHVERKAEVVVEAIYFGLGDRSKAKEAGGLPEVSGDSGEMPF